jgi:5-methylcytosine-specific restriction endonuclease McrA
MKESLTCSICGVVKTLDGFVKDKYSPIGYARNCKDCRKKNWRRWYDNDQTPEKNRAKSARWRIANPKAKRVSNRKWENKNPETVTQYKERRRAKKMALPTLVVSEKDLRRLKAGPCIACNSTDTISIDHKIPVSHPSGQGYWAIGNLQSLCKSCNSSKGARLYSEWRYRGLRSTSCA